MRTSLLTAPALLLLGCNGLAGLESFTFGSGGAGSGPAGSGGAAPAASSSGTGGAATGGGSAATGGAAAAGGNGGGSADPSLVGYWPCDSGSGFVLLDASGNGHDGVLYGATWVAGLSGMALQFPGTSDYAEVSSLAAPAFPSSGTLSMHFRGDYTSDQLDSEGIFGNWDDTRSHIFFRRGNYGPPPNVLQFGLQLGTSYVAVWDASASDDVWHHAVVVWDTDADHARFYLDDLVHDTAISDAAWEPSDQMFRIANVPGGSVDEVRLYDRPLSPMEVAQLPAP